MKTFVLDTNVILQSPYALHSFQENEIVLPEVVLEELDTFKNHEGELGANAREAIRMLERLRLEGDIVKGVALEGGGRLRVELNHVDVVLPRGWDSHKADNRILKVAKGIQATLVTKDIVMRLKASILGLPAEDYKTEQVGRIDEQYTGRQILEVNGATIDEFYREGQLDLRDEDLEENEFVMLRDAHQPSHTAIGKNQGGILMPLSYKEVLPYGVKAKNVGQIFAQEALMEDSETAPLVILKGTAGTAKTFYSLACGLEQVFNMDRKRYKKILITRGNVKMDNDIGFLKGDEQDKIMPLLRSFSDNLERLVDREAKHDFQEVEGKVYYLFDSGVIDVQTLAYMRGRSLTHTFIIIDEAQNLTPNQVLSIITRVGEGSKVVLIGDPEQIDNPKLDSRTNGLVYTGEKMKGSSLCHQVTFRPEECTRSILARVASERLTPK